MIESWANLEGRKCDRTFLRYLVIVNCMHSHSGKLRSTQGNLKEVEWLVGLENSSMEMLISILYRWLMHMQYSYHCISLYHKRDLHFIRKPTLKSSFFIVLRKYSMSAIESKKLSRTKQNP